jgi:hypothetical protein
MKILYLGQIGPGQTALMRHGSGGRCNDGLIEVPSWREVNSTVLSAAREFRPALVWADKQEFLRVETIDALRNLGARPVHFTPDPYFALDWKRTRIMDEAMRQFDVLVYCKSYEKVNYEALGRRPSICRSDIVTRATAP